MSRLVVMLSVSLDGFFEGPGGDLSWHEVSEELHADMNAVLGASAGLLNGRRNWELMSGFWPSVPDDEPAEVREFSAIWKRLPQHVFSTTLTSVEHGATLHRSIDVVPSLLASASAALFAGGGALAASLAERGWVDRYVLHVVPVTLGAGTPLFRQRQQLQLVDQRSYPGGVVQLHYDVLR